MDDRWCVGRDSMWRVGLYAYTSLNDSKHFGESQADFLRDERTKSARPEQQRTIIGFGPANSANSVQRPADRHD